MSVGLRTICCMVPLWRSQCVAFSTREVSTLLFQLRFELQIELDVVRWDEIADENGFRFLTVTLFVITSGAQSNELRKYRETVGTIQRGDPRGLKPSNLIGSFITRAPRT